MIIMMTKLTMIAPIYRRSAHMMPTSSLATGDLRWTVRPGVLRLREDGRVWSKDGVKGQAARPNPPPHLSSRRDS